MRPASSTPNRLPVDAQSWVNKPSSSPTATAPLCRRSTRSCRKACPIFSCATSPSPVNIPVTRPEIYYGEQREHYVIVKTNDREFDYPIGEGSVQTVFEGEGGVQLGSFFKRALLAWEFGDLNILISDSLTDDSRLLLRRNIADRVKTLAPFLHLDYDPYIVMSEGKLYWVQDAYTYTDRFPYSQPEAMPSHENKPAPTGTTSATA